MLILIRHETVYRYAEPAMSALQVLRLTPRSHDGQFVRRWRIDIDADCRLEKDVDALGNIIHTFFVDQPITQLGIVVDGEVEVSNRAGHVRESVERFPVSFWRRRTELTEPDTELAAFARECLAAEGGDQLAAMHTAMARLHRECTFDSDATHAATTAIEAFRQRRGVCQDYAQILIATAREMAVPARYVSGYFLRSDTDMQTAGHAWMEAAIPGLGWIGFDPAHGICVDDRFVRVAIGLDALDAAPIRGVRQGGISEDLSVALRVAKGRSFVEE